MPQQLPAELGMSDERTLFHRGEEDPLDHDEIWDDSALIEAYDRALSKARVELGMTGGGDAKSRASQPARATGWRPGDHCVAEYTEDGLPYEAVILSVDGLSCELEFGGYGNRQLTPLGSLAPSGGQKARRRQQRQAERDAAAEDVEGEEEEESEEREEGEQAETEPREAGAEQRWGAAERAEAARQPPPVPGGGELPPPREHRPWGCPPGAWYPEQSAWGPSGHAHGMGRHPGAWRPEDSGWGPGPDSWGQGPQYGPYGPPPQHGPPPPGYRSQFGPAFPPPPPPVMDRQDPELMANLLMSWYLSGYYTGLYQGRQGRRK